MTSTFVILLITTFVFADIARAQPPFEPIRDCEPNAVWSRCRVPCPPSCEDPTQRCFDLRCQPGCNCMRGYIRKSDTSGECVLPKNCPK